MGDSGAAQALIRTWHRHGYRFVAPVDELHDEEAPCEAVPSHPGANPRGEASPAVGAPQPGPSKDGAVASVSMPVASALSGKEHKQISVLHCAVNDAARLASERSDEEMHELMEQFMTSAHRIVQRYGGTMTQWLNDGLVALFGAPLAYEDHVRRAAAAALELRQAASA